MRSLQEELRKIHGEEDRYLEENYAEPIRRDRARNSHPGAVQTGDFVFLKKAPKLFREESEASARLDAPPLAPPLFASFIHLAPPIASHLLAAPRSAA